MVGKCGPSNIVIRRNYDKSKVRFGNKSASHLTTMFENNEPAPSQQCRDNNVPSRIIAGVSTHNEFEMLAVDDDQQEEPARVSNQTSHAIKKVRCPPIYVYNKSVVEINAIATSLAMNKGEYVQRIGRGVIQITVKDQNIFTSLVSYCKANDIRFYTHSLPDETPIRFVLSGLPVFNNDEVVTELKTVNIEPESVKLLKASPSGDSAIYLVAFKRGACKLQDLRKVRYLFSVVVNWRPFAKRAADIVQCFRCQQFGHGMSHCNLQPKCVKCGELHFTKNCAIPKKVVKPGNSLESENDDRHLIKCANCSRNHAASFRGCPTRLAYLKQLEERKNQARNRHSTSSQPRRPQPAPVRPGVSFAQAVRGEIAAQDSNLFTMSEFLSLARELYTRLSACTSKGMQFLALSELMAKYVCDG